MLLKVFLFSVALLISDFSELKEEIRLYHVLENTEQSARAPGKYWVTGAASNLVSFLQRIFAWAKIHLAL